MCGLQGLEKSGGEGGFEPAIQLEKEGKEKLNNATVPNSDYHHVNRANGVNRRLSLPILPHRITCVIAMVRQLSARCSPNLAIQSPRTDDVPREGTTVRMYRLGRNLIHVSLAETLHLRKWVSPRGLSRRVPWYRRTDTSGGLFCNQSESSAPCFVGKLVQLSASLFCISSLDLNLA
jgi:hypothetical protein